jgi:DNA-binding MarR family transcriptional regulator
MREQFARIPIRAAADRTLGAQDFRVLIAIASHAGRNGKAWPSQARIAALAHIDRRNVPRAIARLEASGLLRRDARENEYGDRIGTTYTVLSTGEVSSSAMAPVISEDDRVSSQAMPGCHLTGCTEYTNGTDHTMSERSNDGNSVAHDQVAEWFQAFWQVYPSRHPHANPRGPAHKSFIEALNRGVNPELIIRGAENYRTTVAHSGTDPRYVAQAVTWLDQERWDDYQQQSQLPRLRAGMI